MSACYDVVAWQYAGDLFSHYGIVSELVCESRLAPSALVESADSADGVTALLELLADTECLSALELSDSNAHPAPVFRDQLEEFPADYPVIIKWTSGLGPDHSDAQTILEDN